MPEDFLASLIDSSAGARKPEWLEAVAGTSVEGALPCLEKPVKTNLEKNSGGALYPSSSGQAVPSRGRQGSGSRLREAEAVGETRGSWVQFFFSRLIRLP